MRKCKTCGKTTKFMKLYCSDHVTQTDYASKIVAGRIQRQLEQDEILARGAEAVSVDGVLAQDLLKFIQDGSLHPLDRIHRLMNLDFEVAKALAAKLSSAGLVKRVGITYRSEGFLALPS